MIYNHVIPFFLTLWEFLIRPFQFLNLRPTINFIFKILYKFKDALAVFQPRRRRHRKLMVWLNNRLDTSVINLETVWRDGSLLCELVNSICPGSCLVRVHSAKTIEHAQCLIRRHFGIPPAFSQNDLQEAIFTKNIETRLYFYLQTVKGVIEQKEKEFKENSPKEEVKEQSTDKFIIKGMGLVTAIKNSTATFYIYPTTKKYTYNFIIKINGPNESFGKLSINTSDCKPSPKKSNIPLTCNICVNCIEVSYTPQYEGNHELAITQNGSHVTGSPFLVSVEKIDYMKAELKCSYDTLGKQSYKMKHKRKKRIVSRIVDFINEKMILTDGGELQKLESNNYYKGNKNNTRLMKQNSCDSETSEVSNDACDSECESDETEINSSKNAVNVYKNILKYRVKINNNEFLNNVSHVINGKPVFLDKNTVQLFESIKNFEPESDANDIKDNSNNVKEMDVNASPAKHTENGTKNMYECTQTESLNDAPEFPDEIIEVITTVEIDENNRGEAENNPDSNLGTEKLVTLEPEEDNSNENTFVQMKSINKTTEYNCDQNQRQNTADENNGNASSEIEENKYKSGNCDSKLKLSHFNEHQINKKHRKNKKKMLRFNTIDTIREISDEEHSPSANREKELASKLFDEIVLGNFSKEDNCITDMLNSSAKNITQSYNFQSYFNSEISNIINTNNFENAEDINLISNNDNQNIVIHPRTEHETANKISDSNSPSIEIINNNYENIFPRESEAIVQPCNNFGDQENEEQFESLSANKNRQLTSIDIDLILAAENLQEALKIIESQETEMKLLSVMSNENGTCGIENLDTLSNKYESAEIRNGGEPINNTFHLFPEKTKNMKPELDESNSDVKLCDNMLNENIVMNQDNIRIKDANVCKKNHEDTIETLKNISKPEEKTLTKDKDCIISKIYDTNESAKKKQNVDLSQISSDTNIDDSYDSEKQSGNVSFVNENHSDLKNKIFIDKWTRKEVNNLNESEYEGNLSRTKDFLSKADIVTENDNTIVTENDNTIVTENDNTRLKISQDNVNIPCCSESSNKDNTIFFTPNTSDNEKSYKRNFTETEKCDTKIQYENVSQTEMDKQILRSNSHINSRHIKNKSNLNDNTVSNILNKNTETLKKVKREEIAEKSKDLFQTKKDSVNKCDDLNVFNEVNKSHTNLNINESDTNIFNINNKFYSMAEQNNKKMSTDPERNLQITLKECVEINNPESEEIDIPIYYNIEEPILVEQNYLDTENKTYKAKPIYISELSLNNVLNNDGSENVENKFSDQEDKEKVQNKYFKDFGFLNTCDSVSQLIPELHTSKTKSMNHKEEEDCNLFRQSSVNEQNKERLLGVGTNSKCTLSPQLQHLQKTGNNIVSKWTDYWNNIVSEKNNDEKQTKVKTITAKDCLHCGQTEGNIKDYKRGNKLANINQTTSETLEKERIKQEEICNIRIKDTHHEKELLAPEIATCSENKLPTVKQKLQYYSDSTLLRNSLPNKRSLLSKSSEFDENVLKKLSSSTPDIHTDKRPSVYICRNTTSESEENNSQKRFHAARMFFETLQKPDVDKINNNKVKKAPSMWEVSSSDLWDSDVIRRKHKTRRKSHDMRETSSAPGSDSETTIATKSVMGGSERMKKVSEKFHVKDLFYDVIGDSKNRPFRQGVPHSQAVLAAMRSLESKPITTFVTETI